MLVTPATASDLPAIAALVNAAYRGDSAKAGWTHESDLLTGQRTDADALVRDLATKPDSSILLLRDTEGLVLGSVWVEQIEPQTCYLGMLTVDPRLQAQGLGRTLLEAAEDHARQMGATRMRMTVIHVRDTLIEWYERRGYRRTGAVEPFPYDDPRVGLPLRDDLTMVVLEKAL